MNQPAVYQANIIEEFKEHLCSLEDVCLDLESNLGSYQHGRDNGEWYGSDHELIFWTYDNPILKTIESEILKKIHEGWDRYNKIVPIVDSFYETNMTPEILTLEQRRYIQYLLEQFTLTFTRGYHDKAELVIEQGYEDDSSYMICQDIKCLYSKVHTPVEDTCKLEDPDICPDVPCFQRKPEVHQHYDTVAWRRPYVAGATYSHCKYCK